MALAGTRRMGNHSWCHMTHSWGQYLFHALGTRWSVELVESSGGIDPSGVKHVNPKLSTALLEKLNVQLTRLERTPEFMERYHGKKTRAALDQTIRSIRRDPNFACNPH